MKKVGELFREDLVNRIKENVTDRSSVFLLSYSGLSGLKFNELRKELKQVGADVYATKNRVAKLTLKDLELEELGSKISGQTAFVWSDADSAAISKVLVNFTKDSELVKVQGGLLDERVLDFSDIKVLSDLPSREVLLSTLLGTIQAPVTRLLGAFNAKSRDLLSILKQLSEQKGGNTDE